MKTAIRNHPIAAYILLTFGWTWLIAFAMLFTGLCDNVATPTPAFILGGILSNISPSIAAFLVTRISGGKEGTRKLTNGLRVSSRGKWYLLTLVIVPSVTAVATLFSNFFIRPYHASFVPPMLVMGLVWPLFSGMGEEFGWRGYFLPRLIRRFGVMKAALTLGIIWEVWHLPMHYMAYKAYGPYMIPAFLTVGFLNLTLQAVIMALLYTINQGNLKLMILYHYTITASAIILGALFATDASPKATVLESLISCALFASIAAVLYLKNKAHFAIQKEEASC